MGKHTVFAKTDLSVPQVDHSRDMAGNVVILPEAIPPTNTTVKFGRNASGTRSFFFARWYGAGIDPITYACQRQIERFLAGQEGAVAATTVTGYCRDGLRNFLDCCVLRATAFGRDLALSDVNRELIDSYLGHLAGLGWAGRGNYRSEEPLHEDQVRAARLRAAWVNPPGHLRRWGYP